MNKRIITWVTVMLFIGMLDTSASKPKDIVKSFIAVVPDTVIQGEPFIVSYKLTANSWKAGSRPLSGKGFILQAVNYSHKNGNPYSELTAKATYVTSLCGKHELPGMTITVGNQTVTSTKKTIYVKPNKEGTLDERPFTGWRGGALRKLDLGNAFIVTDKTPYLTKKATGGWTHWESNGNYLFFDTEATGVPRNYKAPSSDTLNWPRLVQLAWILSDENGNTIHTGNLIVRPDGFTIPSDAARIHGITTQRALDEGVPLEEAITAFMDDFAMASSVVGHNIGFDQKIVGAELIRLGQKDVMCSKKSYCTMLSTVNFCRIPNCYGYKYPKLEELHRKLFGCAFDDAHNAMSDIEATAKCFWELRKRKLI